MAAFGAMALAFGSMAGAAWAESLLDKIKNGEPIRIGYSNDAPWAFPGENNEPLGISNSVLLPVLKKMGATKIESVVTEWGSLIPGLQAGRFDLIADAMYILPARCRNVLFTDPIASVKQAMVVPKGNPKEVHSLEDLRDKGLTFVTGAGFDDVALAKKLGIPDAKIMQVAGYTEIAQAVKAGRADGGGGEYLGMKKAVGDEDRLELAKPYIQSGKPGYPAYAFPLNEQATVDAFNSAMKGYLRSDEMMAAVGKYGYDETILPDGTKTADLCME
ncbi:ectoine/hydroxyectoine ABC transporter substrate-binding protein EhuB [Mesorhizobium sp. WSM3882]|nr:ectoine/hydroxyectoine ABC transporter substrate-binding protein EhuB [Mesorhizobium sp. WSM3882]